MSSSSIQFYFDFVNVYMIEIHHWPANTTELIEAGQWLQLTIFKIILFL